MASFASGELLHATPLTPGEYIAGKYAATLVTALWARSPRSSR